MSKEKPLVFGFVPFFLRQFFDRSKTEFLMFCLFLLQTRILFQNHVVASPFRCEDKRQVSKEVEVVKTKAPIPLKKQSCPPVCARLSLFLYR